MARVLLVIILLLVSAASSNAGVGVWDLAKQIVFPLYALPQVDAFACTGFFWWDQEKQPGDIPIIPSPPGYRKSVDSGSAGHCAHAVFYRARSGWERIEPTFVVFFGLTDFMIAMRHESQPSQVYPTGELLRNPRPGELHYTAGYPGRFGGRVQQLGRLSFVGMDEGRRYRYRTSWCVEPGLSGSPVLTGAGELVGILIEPDQLVTDRGSCSNTAIVMPFREVFRILPQIRPNR